MGFASSGALNALKIAIPLPEELLKQEKVHLMKEKDRLENSIEKTRSQPSNHEFILNAPTHLVEKQKNQMNQFERELSKSKAT